MSGCFQPPYIQNNQEPPRLMVEIRNQLFFLDVSISQSSGTRTTPISADDRPRFPLVRIPSRAYTASVRREMMAGEDYALGHSTHTLCLYTSTQPSLFSVHPPPLFLSLDSFKLRWDFSKGLDGTENTASYFL